MLFIVLVRKLILLSERLASCTEDAIECECTIGGRTVANDLLLKMLPASLREGGRNVRVDHVLRQVWMQMEEPMLSPSERLPSLNLASAMSQSPLP